MDPTKVELIVHPVRLRVLQALTLGPMTTQEIACELPDVPTSSLYRHIRVLLEGELVKVSGTRIVQGIQEKTYQLSVQPRLTADDLAAVSKEDHMRYFTTYALTLLQDFSNYLEALDEVRMLEDRVGYNEFTFWATNEEIDAFGDQLNLAIQALMGLGPGKDRRKRKLSLVLHPIKKEKDENEPE